MAKKDKKTEKTGKPRSRTKTVVVAIICVVLVAAIIFSVIMLLRSKGFGAAAPPEEKYTPEFLPGDVKIVCDLEAEPGKTVPPEEGQEAQASPDAQASQEDQASPEAQPPSGQSAGGAEAETEAAPPPKDWSADPAARYEITLHSARQLSEADKATYGLTKEAGPLALLELDVRLLDPAFEWNLYNRRVQDADGSWLDEIKSVADEDILNEGLSDQETLIVRLNADAPAADETESEGMVITLSVYTASWNKKEEADGLCQIAVEPPPPPGSVPVVRNVDTEYGSWTGDTYTSSDLDIMLTLPEAWSSRPDAVQGSTGEKSIEGVAVRDDGKAAFQLAVGKGAATTGEAEQIEFFRDLLSRAVGDYTIGEAFQFTIAGKDYTGLTYSHGDALYHVYFHKRDNDLIEVTLQLPLSERDNAGQFLDNIKPVS